MPNWCDNTLRLSNENKSKLDEVEAELLKKTDEGYFAARLFEHFRPNPSGEWEYDWSLNNWGTKWDASIIDWERQQDEQKAEKELEKQRRIEASRLSSEEQKEHIQKQVS